MKGRILVVDNDAEMVRLLQQHLEGEGHAVTGVASGREGLQLLEEQPFDVVITDVVMDDVGGLEVLAAASRRQPPTRIVLMTAFGTLDNAIAAIRQGAFDYLTKPFRLDEISVAVDRALADQRVHEENRRMRQALAGRSSFGTLLGRSPAMQAVFERIRVVADSESAVLLLGESGTGKEVVARSIHEHSARRDGPFVPVNCAAIPEPLLESELFGHERGAFTGADRRRRGLFEEAAGGTLFLDEIGDMPAALQPKLLRALQDKAIRPVGSNQVVKLDFRVISATNRDLAALAKDARFREDLYYRLAVIPMRIPALRERPDDIMFLAQHFLERAAQVSGTAVRAFDRAATEWLLQHRWPGNVRELENVVERAVTLASGPEITLADLGTEFVAPLGSPGSLRPSLAELEDEYIRRVLAEAGGDKAAAARILGISVRTLQRRFR
jgi:DNA-binding NtrC family response regulator